MARMLEVCCLSPPLDRFRFRVLDRPLQRLRGLLGTDCDAEPVALVNCHAIHTFGMRYRIDVAFVKRSGVVLEAWSSVPPGRFLQCKGAWATLERPHGRGQWFAQGERVQMSLAEEDGHLSKASVTYPEKTEVE